MWRCGDKDVRVGLGLRAYMVPHETIELAQYAESSGFDHLWCSNEKLNRDMWVMLGMLAASTHRATIGPFVADPYSYHPVLIASGCATVDESSRGRAILLLGAGGTGFTEMGITRQSPASALSESVEIIRKLFHDVPVTFDGRVVKCKNAHLHFKTRSDIPIWIASRGNLTLKMAGRIADGVMIGTYAQPQGIARAREFVQEGCVSAGRKPDSLRITARVDVCIDHDRTLARDAVKPMIGNVIRISYPDQAFIHNAGLALPRRLDEFLKSANPAEVRSRAREMVPDEFVDAFAWAGTPDEVARQIAATVAAGFLNLCIVPNATADYRIAQVVRSFVDDVMPRVQAILAQ